MLYYLLGLDDPASVPGWLQRGEVRVLLAAGTALGVLLLLGPGFIRLLRRYQLLDAQEKGDSQFLDRLHAHKADTPTLGGLLLLAGLVVSLLLWSRIGDRSILLLLGYVLALAVIGFLDDVRKLRTRRKGIRAKTKLAAQVVCSTLVGLALYLDPSWASLPDGGGSATSLFLPFWKDWSPELGVGFVLLSVLVTTGTSNAVNLTDGLDGLAIGSSILVAIPLVIYAVLAGQAAEGPGSAVPRVPAGTEVAVFLGALIGAGVGFLWFNCHPAQVFMGDTGSLPLGGGLGLAAVLCRQEIVLFLAGGVLVMEALSVMLQVGSYKLWRRRIFRIAPLHHHFQHGGWPETKVTVRFWIVGAVLGLLSLLFLRIG